MRRALRRSAMVAAACSFVLPTLAAPAHAGVSTDAGKFLWVGPSVMKLRSWEATASNAARPDSIGFTIGNPSVPNSAPGVRVLSRKGQCDASQQGAGSTYLVEYEDSCAWPTFPSGGELRTGALLWPRGWHGASDIVASTAVPGSSPNAEVVFTDGTIKTVTGGSVQRNGSNGTVAIPTLSYDPSKNLACPTIDHVTQLAPVCQRGSSHGTQGATGTGRQDSPDFTSSLWLGGLNLGNGEAPAYVVATTESRSGGESAAQSIDIYAKTGSTLDWVGSLGSNRRFTQPAAARRLCAPSRIAVGEVSGGATSPRDIVRFGADCSDATTDADWEHTRDRPSGLEVWRTRTTNNPTPEYAATTPAPWRVPSRTPGQPAPRIGDVAVRDLNADGIDDFAFAFKTGGYAVAYSSPGSTDLEPMLPNYAFEFGDSDFDGVPMTQIAVRELSTSRSGYLAAGLPDLAFATPRGLLVLESSGKDAPYVPFADLNKNTPGSEIDRSMLVPGNIEQFAFGQYDNDTLDDVAVYDGYHLTINHQVTRGPSISSFTADRQNTTTAGTVKFSFTQNASTAPTDVLNEQVAKIAIDLDGDGVAGEKNQSGKDDEPLVTGSDLIAKGVEWQPTVARTANAANAPTAYVYNGGGEVTKIKLGHDVGVALALSVTSVKATQPAGEGFYNPWDFAASVTGGTPPYAYAWNVPQASPAPGNVASFTTTVGQYGYVPVTVVVTDRNGITASRTVTIRSAEPIAANLGELAAYGFPLEVGDKISYSGDQGGAVDPFDATWTIDDPSVAAFTNGTGTATTISPDLIAKKAGTAIVTFTVQETTGEKRRAVTTTAVTVVDKLVADFVAPVAPAPGSPAAFSADGKISGGNGLNRYTWSVKRADGSGAATDFTAAASDAVDFEPTFTRAGLYDVTLSVSYEKDRAQAPRPATATKRVKVAAALGGTVASSNPSPQLGESVTLSADVTGGIAPYTYRWDTDGLPGYDTDAGTARTTTRSYPTAGTRNVKVEVTDSGGEKTELNRTVGVAVPLAAAFTRSVAQPLPDVEFTADAGTTGGGVPPYTYEWRFDDTVVAGATGALLRRTVPAAGRHSISLTVTDATGRTDGPVRQGFKVAAPVTARIAVSDDHPQATDELTLDASGSTGGLPPFTYTWDLDGDGSFETDPSTTPTRTVALPSAGVSTVGVRVTDADGVAQTASRVITTTAKLAAVFSATPDLATPGQTVAFSAAGSAGGTGALTYRWDLDGDGTFETDTAGDATTSRAYAVPADFTLRVRVTDAYGHTAEATTRLSVAAALSASLTGPAVVEAGDPARFDASGSMGGVGTKTYAFDLDGNGSFETDAGTNPVFETTYRTAQAPAVGVRVRDERGQEATAQTVVAVDGRLEPALTGVSRISQDRRTTFSAADTVGGAAPLAFAFDTDGDGSFERAAGSATSFETSFATVGTKRVGVRVTDARGRVREARRVVEVTAGCQTRVDLPLGTVVAEPNVCLRDEGSEKEPKLVSNGPVKLNGQLIDVPAGKPVSVTPATKLYPGGRIVAGAATVAVQGTKVFEGALDWRLPSGPPGTERQIGSVGLPEDGIELLGLEVEGRVAVGIGTDSAGTDYLRFMTNLSIPSFRVSPDEDSPSVTGAMNLRVDKDGPHTDNVLVRAESAYLGAVQVNDICLSYLAKGVSEDDGARCEQFEDFDGESFLTCQSNDDTERWDGTVDVTFPGSGTGIAASGGVADGKLASLALKGEFGRKVPLKPGAVWLKGIAAGVCLTPQLKIKGSAKIGAIASGADEELITANGSFEFNDSYEGAPWSIMLRGGLEVMDHEVGQAYFGLDGNNTATFGWKAGMAFPHDKLQIATIDGAIDGWVELRNRRFNVEGKVEACIVSLICTGGEAVLSTDGVAACVTLFRAKVYYPTVWPPDYDSYEVEVRGGFGYRWGGGVSVMAASCDIGPWRATRSSLATRSQVSPGTRTFEVAEGQPVATVRVGGQGVAPKITLRGPKGEVISSVADKPAVYVEGQHMVYEDTQSPATQAMVFKPSPGTWTIEAQPGSTLTGELQQADYIAPTSTYAKVAGRPGDARRRVEYAYTVQPDTTVRLVEVSKAKGLRQTVGTLKPGRCERSLKGAPKSARIGCGTLSFKPTSGKGGKRDLVAEVVRGGLTVDTQKVTTFKVSGPKRLKASDGLQLKRTKKGTAAAWNAVPGAVGYDVVTKTVTGGTVLTSVKRTCRRLFVPGVPKGTTTTITVRAMDALGRPGRARTVSLKGKAKVAGAKTAPRAGC